MIRVINGEITEYFLPKTGKLSSGETVSNYNLLSTERLKEEGWLPLEDIQPEYNKEAEYLVTDGYEIQKNKVIKKYKIEELEDLKTPTPASPQEEIAELKEIISILLDD